MLLCVNSHHQPWNSTLPTLTLLPNCKTSNDVNQIHARLLTTGFIRNDFLTTKIILNFISSPHARLVEFARHVFFTRHAFRVRRKQEDPFLWNAVMKSYSHGWEPKQALAMFCLMLENGVCVDKFTFSLVLKACSRVGLVKEGMQIHGLLKKMEFGLDVFLQNCVIWWYLRCGFVEIARQVFDRMPKRDSVSYNSMIDGYVKCGMIITARELFDCMPSEIIPDATTLLIVLSAIAQLGHIEKGIALHRYLEENGFSLNGKLGVALIDMYSKCGSIGNAKSVFENIEEKSIDHWNAMIGGLAIHGLGKLAFDLFMEMGKLCVKPDDITFIGVLNACGHAGLVKEGLVCFDLMRRVHKVEPKLQHYGCMVDIFCRSGHIEEARALIEEMPIKPNDVIWRTLLGACKNQENFNIGEPIANYLIGLDYNNPSSYVLLSNIYAGQGMWNDVSRVRMMMKERNLKKTPGCSWIELEGTVHEFFVHDKSHPQVTEIYSMLNNLWIPNSGASYCQS
ncbi:pentatricopeptide repeat-containing protein [Quercus suber]|uniref:Pentatricopeptide repeat-containing protein n=1 Tax=Quercus suber TaxID=58331 RepID=A0AAW0KDJ1_QUESU